MIINIDTDSSSTKDIEQALKFLQEELELRKERSLNNRKYMTVAQRLERLRKKDMKTPGFVRIFDEDNEKSCLVPYVQNGQYKLVRAADLRLAISRKGVARWFGGLREGEQAWIEPLIKSFDGDVLICGSDAFKLLDDDFEHPRFVI